VADNKLTKSVGEHWTCAMLSREGWAPALTRDGIARTDILAVATHLETRPMVEVQVKTATGAQPKTSWHLGQPDYDRSGSEWFVLVAIPTQPEPPRGFVVPRDHVAAASWIVHTNWRTSPDAPPGKRNAPIGRARVQLSVFAEYENRWDLLKYPTSAAPVLLPKWLRDRAQETRAGLPQNHPWRDRLPLW
jgi:hypothetical protein